jgi:hypothetical protein
MLSTALTVKGAPSLEQSIIFNEEKKFNIFKISGFCHCCKDITKCNYIFPHIAYLTRRACHAFLINNVDSTNTNSFGMKTDSNKDMW